MGSLKVWCIAFVVVLWNTWNRNLNYLFTQIIHIQFYHLVRSLSYHYTLKITGSRNNCNIATKITVIWLNEFFNQWSRWGLQPFVFRYIVSKWTLYSKNVYIVAWHNFTIPFNSSPYIHKLYRKYVACTSLVFISCFENIRWCFRMCSVTFARRQMRQNCSIIRYIVTFP